MPNTRSGSSSPYVQAKKPGESDEWTRETAGRGTQKLLTVAEVPPTEEVRRGLRLDEGEQVVVRRRLISLDGAPVELADSYYPAQVAADTGLAQPARIRGGAPTLLAGLGYRASRVIEEIEAGAASADQAELLDIPENSPVLTLFRISLTSDDTPFEVTHMVMRSPRRLHYEMDL